MQLSFYRSGLYICNHNRHNMKKLFTLLTVLSSFYYAHSQSFTLSKHQVNAEGPNGTNQDALCTITNVSSDINDTNFKWTVVSYSTPMGWQSSYCDTKDCYYGITMGMNRTFNLRQNGSGPLKANFDFQGVQGTGCMTVLVSSVKYPANTDTVTYCATAWPTAIRENTAPRSFSLYPNPAHDQINVNFNAKDKFTVEIFNVLGCKVRSFTQDANTLSIDISDLDKGLYFIRIREKNNVLTRSFTKAE